MRRILEEGTVTLRKQTDQSLAVARDKHQVQQALGTFIENSKNRLVLTNANGLTLYWFAPDTPVTSRCTGSCSAYWPPVTGKPKAGPGVTGELGTVNRPGGGLQATYDGHPLYTYVGDNGPGQAQGDHLNLNGGLWYEVRVSG